MSLYALDAWLREFADEYEARLTWSDFNAISRIRQRVLEIAPEESRGR